MWSIEFWKQPRRQGLNTSRGSVNVEDVQIFGSSAFSTTVSSNIKTKPEIRKNNYSCLILSLSYFTVNYQLFIIINSEPYLPCYLAELETTILVKQKSYTSHLLAGNNNLLLLGVTDSVSFLLSARPRGFLQLNWTWSEQWIHWNTSVLLKFWTPRLNSRNGVLNTKP